MKHKLSTTVLAGLLMAGPVLAEDEQADRKCMEQLTSASLLNLKELKTVTAMVASTTDENGKTKLTIVLPTGKVVVEDDGSGSIVKKDDEAQSKELTGIIKQANGVVSEMNTVIGSDLSSASLRESLRAQKSQIIAALKSCALSENADVKESARRELARISGKEGRPNAYLPNPGRNIAPPPTGRPEIPESGRRKIGPPKVGPVIPEDLEWDIIDGKLVGRRPKKEPKSPNLLPSH